MMRRSRLCAAVWLPFGRLLARAGVCGEGAVTFEVRGGSDRPTPNTRQYLDVQVGTTDHPEKLLLVDPPLLDSAAIRLVTLDYTEEDRPVILITLTAAGARKFEQVTKDAIGKRLGLLIGGQVYSTPMVMEPVHGGKIAITGAFTGAEAANLVERLNAGVPKG